MSLSTVSKALKTLEEDLSVERSEDISLLQPDKLLGKLCDNYIAPKIRDAVRLKIPGDGGILSEWIGLQAGKLSLPVAATGLSSVSRYTVMQRAEMLSVYCPETDALAGRLKGDASSRFPNIELIWTEDEPVYFDARRDGNFRWASPIQVYLELMAGDKRDQETAEAVKSYIIESIRGWAKK